MTDLLKLADRVEAGESHFTFHMHVRKTLGVEGLVGTYNDTNFTGSLDAAKDLHDLVLPGWTLYSLHQRPDDWFVSLYTLKGHAWSNAEAPTPAAAWVAAILRAKAGESVSGTQENDQ